MDPAALRNRLVMATSMWRETTEDPLPKMPPGDPAEQITGFELQLVELMFAEATPISARKVADKTWDLVHDRSDSDPVKARVVQGHEQLAKLAAEGGDQPE
jgi:hypothetical protein